MMDSARPSNPFPGLRPFRSSESRLFFGRESQSDELLKRLARHRFVAVLGDSGSGKSSLVRAGLLPAISSGFMSGAGTRWQIATFRPGSDPIGEMARALAAIPGFAPLGGIDAALADAEVEATLRRSGLGLIDAMRYSKMPAGESLLVVIDQFEELFRFRQSNPDDANAFAKMVLEAVSQEELPIYAVLTMRSEYLGRCSQFRGLPERINAAQYLIPRMTRDQQGSAITGPALVGGGRIAPRLVNRLLNDMEQLGGVAGSRDQLPILQHALARTWERWSAHGAAAGSDVDIEDYEAIGGMAEALSRNADEAFGELSPDLKKTAETVFKRLTEKGPDNLEIRSPARLAELVAVSGASEADVRRVIDVFRREGRSFLTPDASEALTPETVIDISHESLIAGWKKLRAWVEEESQSAQIFKRLVDTAQRHEADAADLYSGPDLYSARAWRKNTRPTEAWAKKYSNDFALAMSFLDASQKAALSRRLLPAVSVLLLGVVGFLLYEAYVARAQTRDREWREAVAEGSFVKASHLLARLGETEASRMTNIRRLMQASLVRRFAFPSREATFRRFDMKAGEPRFPELSPDKHAFLALAPENQIVLVNAESGERIAAVVLDPVFEDPAAKRQVQQTWVFSHAGNRLAAWGADRVVRIWNTRDGSQVGAPIIPGRELAGAGFSPDDRSILTWGANRIQVWNAESGRLAGEFGGGSPVRFAEASPDGQHVVAGSDSVGLWTIGRGAPAETRLSDVQPYDALFGPASADRLLTRNSEGASLWRVSTGGLVRALSRAEGDRSDSVEGVTGGLFSPGGKWVLTLGASAQLWNAQDGMPVPLMPRDQNAADGVFRDDDLLMTRDTQGLILWDLKERRSRRLKGSEAVLDAEFSPDGDSVMGQSALGRVRIWNVADGAARAELFASESAVVEAKLAPNHLLLTWTQGPPGDEPPPEGGFSFSAAVQRVGKWFAKAAPPAPEPGPGQSVVSIWSLSGLPSLKHESLPGRIGVVTAGDASAVFLWNHSDGLFWNFSRKESTPRRFSLPGKPETSDAKLICGAELSAADPKNPEKQSLLVWNFEGTAWLCQPGLTPAGPCKWTTLPGNVGGAVFAPAGSPAASQTLLTWNGRASGEGGYPTPGAPSGSPGARLLSFPGGAPRLVDGERMVTGAAWSPDGRRIATWSEDALRLWNASDGSAIGGPLRHDGGESVQGARFDEAGGRVVSWSPGPPAGSACVWNSSDATKAFCVRSAALAGALFERHGGGILTWTRDGFLQRWSGEGSRSGFPLEHGRSLQGAAFGASGGSDTLLSWSDQGARVWNHERASVLGLSRKELMPTSPLTHEPVLQGAAFSPDGSFVLTWGADQTVRLWNSVDGSAASRALLHSEPISGALFVGGGDSVLTWSGDSSASLWAINGDLDFPVAQLEPSIEILTGTAMNERHLHVLSPCEWSRAVKDYESRAKQHWEICRYPAAILYYPDEAETAGDPCAEKAPSTRPAAARAAVQ